MRLSVRDFAEFMVLYAAYQREYGRNQRAGQMLWNVLRLHWPVLSDELRDTEFDCFYDDSRVTAFLERISE